MTIGLGRLLCVVIMESNFFYPEMENDCQRSWNSILLCVFLTLKHYEKAANVFTIDSVKSNYFNFFIVFFIHESGINFNDMQMVSDHSYLAFLMNRKLY